MHVNVIDDYSMRNRAKIIFTGVSVVFVSVNAVDCPERFVSEMTFMCDCYWVSGCVTIHLIIYHILNNVEALVRIWQFWDNFPSVKINIKDLRNVA